MTGAGAPPGDPGAAAVEVFVQTRGTGRAADYAFLGAAPPRPWWRAYRDATAFDHPTVLVASDGSRWGAYLSGIPSERVDAVGTVVRYTLVLDGPCGAAAAGCVGAAVAVWLDDVAAGLAERPGGRLPAALDARFPEADVERFLAPAAGGVGSHVRDRALSALASLPTPPAAADLPGDWIGAVTAPAARAAFTARVAALVGGAPGRALLLNLVGAADDAAALLDPHSPVAVLVEGTERTGTEAGAAGPDPARPRPLRAAVGAKKAPAPPPPARRAGAVTAGTAALSTAVRTATALAVVLVALVVAVLILL